MPGAVACQSASHMLWGAVVTETPAIVLRDGAVTLGGRRVLADLDLEVARGEFVAVLGSNGAGKTTLLRALLGLLPLSTGGVHVLDTTPAAARPRIGYVPQRRYLDLATRIRGVDLVRLGLEGDRWGFPLPVPGFLDRSGQRRRSRERVAETITLVDSDHHAYRPLAELSGGEQQRLLIARALVRHPELLMLDEPLDGLDLGSQASISALVSRVSRDRGVTVLLVAHDVNPLLPYVDRVIYLAGGRAVIGSPADVITSETLSRLYGVSVEVLRASDGRLVVVGAPEPSPVHGDHHGG